VRASDHKAVGVRRWAKTPAPVSDPRAELRRELLRWSLCKTFVFQFSVIAKPSPKAKKRKGGHWGDSGGRQPVRRQFPTKRAPGLAAVKHAQQLAGRGGLAERQEKAIGALAAVQGAARAEWPEAMKREMQACRTAVEQRLWAEKRALHLAGRVVAEGAPERPSGGGSIVGGCQPS
jgi:hypothetical protein